MASREQIAASVATWLFRIIAFIQVGIALGVFPVTIVWGGSQSRLTLGLRFASLAAAAILVAFSCIVQKRMNQPDDSCTQVLVWIVAAYMALNTLGNFTSPNWFERYVFGCMTTVLAICTAIVASSPKHEPGEYETLGESDNQAEGK